MELHHRIAIALMCLALAGCRSTNFHVVEEGKLLRSAQLERAELEQAIDQYKIKTVINLRGERPGAQWYDDELDVVTSRGVKLVNIGMSPDRFPHKNDLVALLDAYREAPRPILIHCQAGADRTGEAAAIYQIEYQGKSLDEAMKMLGVKYKHYSLRKPAKKAFMKIYQGESWARTTYDPCAQKYEYYDQDAFCSVSDPSLVPEQEPVESTE